MNSQSDPARSLRDETLWTRRIAVALVSDPGTADDLVQETWTSAIQRFGRDVLPPRSWLAGRLRSLAHGRRRGAVRRTVRERESARREALPSTEELVAQGEAQGRVARAVRELAEPDRRLLLLHYQEGVALTEIARELGVSKSTASERHVSALRRLRRQLEAEDGADWQACLLVASTALGTGSPVPDPTGATPAPETVPSGAVETLANGTLLANANGKAFTLTGVLLLVIGAVGGLAAGLWDSDANGDDEPTAAALELAGSEDPRGPTPDAGPDPDGEGREDRRAALVAAEAPAPAEVYTLRGEVRDRSGTAIPNAKIALTYRERRELRWRRDFEVGPEGVIDVRLTKEDLSNLPPSATIACKVSAGPWFVPRITEFADEGASDRPLPRVGSTDDLGVFELAAAGVVIGRVVDEVGTAVTGATVELDRTTTDQGDSVATSTDPGPNRSTRSDEDGRFRFEGIAMGSYLVDAEAPTCRPIQVRPPATATEDGEAREVLVVLTRCGNVRGSVVDEDGEPLSGAYVCATGNFTIANTVRSDDDGTFVVPLRKGDPAVVECIVPGYEQVLPNPATEFGSGDEAHFVLRRIAARTVVRVVDAATGQPLPEVGCRELAGLDDPDAGEAKPALRGAWGSTRRPKGPSPRPREDGLVPTGTGPGEGRLWLTAPGYHDLRVPVLHEELEPPHMTVELEPLTGITARVLREGRPVGGARVRLRVPRFRLAVRRITVTADGLRESKTGPSVARGLGYDSYEIKPVVGIGAPVPTHRYLPFGPRTTRSTRTDPDGRFTFDRLGPGAYIIEIEDGTGTILLGYGTETLEKEEGRQLDLGDVEFAAPATVRGRFVVRGARLPEGLAVRCEGVDRTVPVGPEGHFTFDGLPPGERYLELDVGEGEGVESSSLTDDPSLHLVLSPGEQRSFQLDLTPWIACELDLRVTIGGVPAPKYSWIEVEPMEGLVGRAHIGQAVMDDGRVRGEVRALGTCWPYLHLWDDTLGKCSIPASPSTTIDLTPGRKVSGSLDFAAGRIRMSVPKASPLAELERIRLSLLPVAGGDVVEVNSIRVDRDSTTSDGTRIFVETVRVPTGKWLVEVRAEGTAASGETLATFEVDVPPGGWAEAPWPDGPLDER